MKKLNKIISIILMLGILLMPSTTLAMTKKETVFTNLDDTGKQERNIVNNYLSFIDKETEDETTLKDILNISGDEKLNRKGSKITFNTNGKDLTYEGITTKKLPIDISIDYYLDNTKIDVNKLVNKKGHITIDINIENNMYNKNYNLHTPFVVTSALILDLKNNSNIEITNGKVLNTGTRSILVGVSAPGLYEDLGIEKFNSLDTISIEYDTKSFEKKDIYLVGTPKLLDEEDIKYLDKLDALENNINTLEEGANKLEKGSKDLYKGTKTLNKGTKTLKNGLNDALNGSLKLKEGTKEVDNSLNEIINGLKENKKTLDKKSSTLISKLESINELKTNNTSAINKLTTANSMIESTISGYGLDVTSSTFESEVDAFISAYPEYEKSKETLLNSKMQYDGNINIITLLTINNSTIDTLVTSLTTTSNDIETSLNALDTYLNKLKEEGTSPIKDGQDQLYNGLEKLYNGSKKLNKGTKKIKNGSKELANGIEKLNKEGISKITDTVKSLDKYKDKVNNLITLSKKYKGYASSNSDSTTFIFKINK